jgi:sugar phosphate isomerase/epimerase
MMTRREHLRRIGTGAAALACLPPEFLGTHPAPDLFFKIALGEYSFNSLFRAGEYDPLDLAGLTRNEFGLDAIDYVSSFWADKANDQAFLRELKKRAEDHRVFNHVILVDLPQSELGDLEESKRLSAVEAHREWIEIARFLGCPSVRVNLNGFKIEGVGAPGHKEGSLKASVDGYRRLLKYGAESGINVIVQNHLGYSCDPRWLVSVMKQVNSRFAGIQADPDHFEELFIAVKPGGNNEVKKGESFDKYRGLEEIMPYAKAVNAKTHAFDAAGNETALDYRRILQIVKRSGYQGYIGIEWEPEEQGRQLTVFAGIKATKGLLQKFGAELSG